MELKYTRLFDKHNNIVNSHNGKKGELYKMYKNEPLVYIYKEPYTRKDGVKVRGHFSLKANNPFYESQGESVEHYEAKMKIAEEKKYFDTIFNQWVHFEDVVPERKINNKIPD